VQENIELKKLFSGKKESGIFAGVLARGGGTPFGTFLLDVGSESGVKNGDMVLVDQNIALGKITETYSRSVKIKLFSASGETTDVFLGPENIPAQLNGVGGGVYTALLPRELDIQEGDAAVLSGVEGFILAYVESKESNPSEAFQKIYLRSPVNVFEVKYLQILPFYTVDGSS
jgi:cell shape-determining protein MreC